jgi:acyl transferase domain-containing protein/thioesterase domain-containing protein
MLQFTSQFDARPDGDLPEGAIAIVGMSCRVAGARGLDAYWDLLRSGREAIETRDDDALLAAGVAPALLRQSNYVRRCAPLEDMECFDAALFGLSPRDAAIMDPQHRHFLECTWEALENAGHVPQRFDGAIGVFAGSGHNAYMPYHLLTNPRLVRDVGLFLLRHTSNDKDFLTTRVSYLLDLTGPSINVQTACSTSLVSIHMAAQSLLNGECDMAIAGGVSIELPHGQGYLFEEGEILSPDGHCRPFDAQSRGTVFGSGVAVVVLRRLADAVQAGDHIYAVVRGSAINNDGAGKVGYLAPSVDGQAKVIAEALAIADVDPATIGYVETHGTGTPVGDPIEVAALTQAFGGSASGTGRCAIGSVKANIGHTDTAAGAAGLIKVALAMHNREMPPSINFISANPDCGLERSPFVVQAQRAPWIAAGVPLRAGVSSLGVGGTNAHVVLEEAPARTAGSPGRATQLLLVSGKTKTALTANAAAHADHLAAHPGLNLADAAYTLSTGRQHLPLRRYAVASDGQEAAEALRQEAGRSDPVPACIPGRPVAFLFCGAGSQHVDMARGLYRTEPTFRDHVDAGLAVLDRLGLPDVRRWLFPSEEDRASASAALERPPLALPALFVIQVALARQWMSLGIEPAGMIGHSSGEYAAAHVAGVMDLEAGLRIVSARGRLFEMIERGGMLSVPIAEAELAPLLPDNLSIAAINSPRLCVVSGPSDAIARLRDELAAREIEAQVVRISVAAHSPMLDPILPQFRALMETVELRAPRLPFASNLTGDWVSDAQATSADYWVRHLRQTVRFTDGLQRLLGDPARVLLEVGPGRAMASLVRQHPERPREQPVVSSLPHPDQPVADERFFWSSLGELWTLGVDINWDAYWRVERRARLPLPTYRFDRERHWIEPGNAALAGADPDALDRRDDVAEWYYEPVWARTARVRGQVGNGTALVFEDEAGLGSGITAQLRDSGRKVITVRVGHGFRQIGADQFSIAPANAAHYSQMFDRLAAVDELPSEIWHCWSVSGERRRSPAIATTLDRGVFSLTAMAPQLARQAGDTPVQIAFVTDRAHRVCTEAAPMPGKAAAVGALPVIGTEYPNLHLHAIDVALPARDVGRRLAEMAEAVIAELSSEEPGAPVCYRAGERWVLEQRPVAGALSDAAAGSAIEAGATYLVTGGLGGIGLALARHLAERQAKVALVVRNALPPREAWPDILSSRSAAPAEVDRIRKLLALEASGAAIEIVVADVTDARAIRRAVRTITTRLGRIAGVFHAAGTLDDGLMETRTRQAMEAVLGPKVAGTLALEAALAQDPPQFLVLFSSISAFAGLPGQVDYAAANAFLDAYAQARREDPQTRVLSIGWSQWREVGMAAALERPDMGAVAVDPSDKGTPIEHPFLDRLHTVDADLYVATSLLSPERHWLLDEHRVAGTGAVIPGTGYLELIRAAHQLIDPGPCAISDVLFLSPFAVADGETRELRVELRRRAGAEWRVLVLGRTAKSEESWVEHASGLVRPLQAEAPAPLMVDWIEAHCLARTAGAVGKSHMLAFGPRWDNVRQTALGEGEGLVHLELSDRFEADLVTLALHPALLDLATAGAQALIPGYDPLGDLFAPFAYRRIALHAPLQASMISHIRYSGTPEPGAPIATFDVTIADEAGGVLATIEGFTMMRVHGGLRPAGAAGGAAPVAASTAPVQEERLEGILPEQGLAVIEQLLAGKARPHTIVSPYPLAPMLAQMRAPRVVARRSAADDAEVSAEDLPATVMEQTIAELWEDLLGVAPVLRHDSFFDLGGHSLLAVQFTNRFRKKTGKVLPLSALLETPTISHLARVADPDSAPLSADEAYEAAPAGPKDVVLIRPGGALSPIFFIHDGLGETLLYRGLALRLDPERPVYGIEPLRTAAGQFAHTSIDEMAANYVARLRSVQPHGPYLLAGLCAGGVIAFEMAQQLRAQGESVAFVGIIDAADVEADKRSFYITRQRLKRARALLGQGANLALLPALGQRLANAITWEARSRLRRARDRQTVRKLTGLNTAGSDAVAARADAPAIGFLQLYEVAHRAHRPKGLFAGGEVALFKATQGSGAIEDIPYQEIYRDFVLGWGRRVEAEVVVAAVPGGHGSVLQEPHVAALALRFQDAVDSAMHDVAEGPSEPSDPEEAMLIAVAAE